MRIEINNKWKEEMINEIEKNKKIINEKYKEFSKTHNAELLGSIDFYERENQYLRGKLDAIKLIEQGCFVEGVRELNYKEYATNE